MQMSAKPAPDSTARHESTAPGIMETSGKPTLLRTLNRMHETVRQARLEGSILLDGEDILAQDVTRLRRRVGMVFQKPNPFPKSIFENVAYGFGDKLSTPS